jgi:hemerythrin superfamily protein
MSYSPGNLPRSIYHEIPHQHAQTADTRRAGGVVIYASWLSNLNQGDFFMASKKTASRSKTPDAVALLKADHRQVEQWFSQFDKSNSKSKKQQLADSICEALTIHTTIEEEIFYPAFLQATKDKDLHHEAVVEHAGAKNLIAEIQDMSSSDDFFDAKVTVLSEMIKHHVKEEEQPGGMFAEAKKSKMDLQQLGEQLAARKQELQAQPKAA